MSISLLFKLLPNEIIRYILKYLNLKEISYFEISLSNNNERTLFLNLISKLKISSFSFVISSNNLLNYLIKRKILLNEITIKFNSLELNELIELNKNELKSVTLLCSEITDNLLMKLKECNQVDTLTLDSCINVTHGGFKELFSIPNKLKKITINNCIQLTNQSIRSVLTISSNLQYLKISGIESIFDDEIFFLIKNCPDFRVLFLNRVNITDRSIQALLKDSPNIQSIILEDCFNISTSIILSILQLVSSKMLFCDNNIEIQELSVYNFRVSLLSQNYHHVIREILSLNLLPQFIYLLTQDISQV